MKETPTPIGPAGGAPDRSARTTPKEKDNSEGTDERVQDRGLFRNFAIAAIFAINVQSQLGDRNRAQSGTREQRSGFVWGAGRAKNTELPLSPPSF